MTREMSAGGSSLVRVRPETRQQLQELAGGQPLTQYLAFLTDQEYRRSKLVEFNEAYARLQADPERYAAYRAESTELEGTLMDGLEEEEGIAFDDGETDTATW